MADQFQLRIVTPVRVVLDEQVREVTAPGTAGQFGVLPGHVTFLSSLEVGALAYKTDRGTFLVAVRGGFAEVKNDVMTVLADTAMLPQEIDVAGAEQDLRAASKRLGELVPADEAYAAAVAERDWAQTRLEVARAK